MNTNRTRGMSLIELLTVVAIVAILGSLAVSSYSRFTLRANRTDATTALLRIQVAEEKFFLSNNTYTTDFTTAPPTGLGILTSASTTGGRYTVAIAAGNTGSIANSYTASAAAAGQQTDDSSACQTFSINESGTRSPLDSTGCWK